MRDVRPWTYAALFGALWGALEATLGTAVHLGKMPMRGAVMGLVGLFCLLCLRRLQPVPGVCLLAGVVAIFLKVFTLGGLYPGPIIGIAVQSLAVEAAMTLSGGRSFGAAIGGAVALATNPVQRLSMMWLVAGPEGVGAYLGLIRDGAAAVGLRGMEPRGIVGGMVMANALLGAFGGLWAWRVAGRVCHRVGERR